MNGIDVSQYQPGFPWASAKMAGYEFAFIRASSGMHGDTLHADHVKVARCEDFIIGSYHYLGPQYDGKQQADLFYQMLAKSNCFFDPLPPVLDVEHEGTTERHVLEFLNAFRNLWDMVPMIYTSAYKWHRLVGRDKEWAKEYPLWVAHWQKDGKPESPTLPTPWTEWVVWQTGSKGRIPGYPRNVDTDVMEIVNEV